MLDVLSFIESRGGNPELIRESQRRRHAPVEAVDEVIALFEEFRVGMEGTSISLLSSLLVSSC